MATLEFVVKHKNPAVPETKDGTVWATDGAGLGWTKAQAEAHAARCEFQARGILFEVKEYRPAAPAPRPPAPAVAEG